MSKAEKRAHECYPDDDVASIQSRFGFLLGYQQAEKDLELGWEDMMLIHKCIKDAMNYHQYKMMQGVEGQKVIYQEVLKRFKEQKGERHKDENIGI